MSSARQPSPLLCAPQTRDLHGDEDHVVFAYESHAKSCVRCGDPLGSAGLCYRGIPLAHNVVKYLYRRRGSFYACRNHEGDKTDRVYLPTGAHSARRLLTAVEQGLLKCSGAGDPGHCSIEIIERQPRYSGPRYSGPSRPCVLYPFSCQRSYIHIPHRSQSRRSGSSPLRFRIGVRRHPRRSTIEFELKFYAEG